MTKTLSIYDLSHFGLENFLKENGEPPFRSDQIWQGLYKNLWNNRDQFSNIPKTLRGAIFEHLSLDPLQVVRSIASQDGLTSKTLFSLGDDKTRASFHERLERQLNFIFGLGIHGRGAVI